MLTVRWPTRRRRQNGAQTWLIVNCCNLNCCKENSKQRQQWQLTGNGRPHLWAIKMLLRPKSDCCMPTTATATATGTY